MKIAFFSPLNPVQSGISDYSEELLLAMAGARIDGEPLKIDLFIDKGYVPSNREIARRFRVLPGRSFGQVAGEYAAVVYQMGNSSAHAYIYNELMRHPGVVVMHEFVLHHLRIWMTLNGGKRKEYINLMEQRHGQEGREAARRVMLGQFPEALFKYPLSEDAINRARGIIVHSRYMEGLVRQIRPDASLAVVPMGVPLPPEIPKEEARQRLSIDQDTFLVTSVGHLNPYKRVSATLRAFKALLMEVPRSLYLLVGSKSPNYDPTRQIEMLGLEEKVRFTGYASPQEFPLYLAASDVCLNLRYPTAGETSASLLRIMGAGVPVLVSRTGSFEELPDDAAGKVDIGDIEEELLLEYMLLLARRPDVRQAMARAARRYVAQHHTLEQATLGYLRFLAPGAQIEPAPPDQTLPTSNHTLAPAIQKTPNSAAAGIAPQQRSYDPLLGLVAEAAAEIGITDEHEGILKHISAALAGAIPRSEDDVAR
ncbi:MAG TPA: glycosyltransferase family 4 protein [Chloroflexia bacterium]|nr:glycosyltransferase family 4 protein [Chloroflexia bacterium]